MQPERICLLITNFT